MEEPRSPARLYQPRAVLLPVGLDLSGGGAPAIRFSLHFPDDVSDSEESISSNKSCRNERSLQEKLEIVTNEGLLLTVKVFLDWLRTNTDLIIMCAQVGALLGAWARSPGWDAAEAAVPVLDRR